jgi:hypothetical protein
VKLEDRPGRPPGVDRLEADVVGDGPLAAHGGGAARAGRQRTSRGAPRR